MIQKRVNSKTSNVGGGLAGKLGNACSMWEPSCRGQADGREGGAGEGGEHCFRQGAPPTYNKSGMTIILFLSRVNSKAKTCCNSTAVVISYPLMNSIHRLITHQLIRAMKRA